jgi:16S rRNA (guanine527-N7)-methyltransferase
MKHFLMKIDLHVTEALRALNLHVNAMTHYEDYVSLLMMWNKIHNLTGAKNPTTIWNYILDSVQPLAFLDSYTSMLDIGSGAGFPGLILAIAKPHIPVTLTEPIQKKAAFLHCAKAEFGLKNVTIMTQRVEQIPRKSFDLIVSRAVMDSKNLISLARPFSLPCTQYLFYKGEQVNQEIDSTWDYDIITQGTRAYLYIKNLGENLC